MFLHPLPTAEQLDGFYDAQYYGDQRKKFAGVLEACIRFLTGMKWGKLRPFAEHGRMLDIGCGRGTLVQLARADGVEAYGLERPFPGAPPAPHVICQDLRDCNFPDGHFQLVILWHVLEHLENPRARLREIHRILKPGGWFSVAVPNFGGTQARASGRHWFHLDLPRHFWHFEPFTLEAMLREAGFEIMRRSTLSFEYDWYGTIQSWMNRAVGDENRLYKVLQGRSRESGGARVSRLLLASLFAPFALASTLWDAARGHGGTLTFLARRSR